MWVNLIRLTVPAVTGNDTPVYHDRHMVLYDYHRDLNSAITLVTNASISEFEQKTWEFLIYPEDDDAENTTFGDLMKRVLVGGVLPLARHYFQGFFSPRGYYFTLQGSFPSLGRWRSLVTWLFALNLVLMSDTALDPLQIFLKN